MIRGISGGQKKRVTTGLFSKSKHIPFDWMYSMMQYWHKPVNALFSTLLLEDLCLPFKRPSTVSSLNPNECVVFDHFSLISCPLYGNQALCKSRKPIAYRKFLKFALANRPCRLVEARRFRICHYIGEKLVGPCSTLFMDEISTGLDSSTTFLIVKCIRNFVHMTQVIF